MVRGGRKSLEAKLGHVNDLEGKVRELYARCCSVKAITRQLMGTEAWLLYLFSAGDVSKRNLARFILLGPAPRPDLG